jgi:peroxiredoxin
VSIHRANRPYVYVCVIATQLIILNYFLKNDTDFQWYISNLSFLKNKEVVVPNYTPSNDLPIGFKLPKSVTDVVKQPGPYLLVPIRNCGTCISISLKNWYDKAKENNVTLVLITPSSDVETRELQREVKINCPVIHDPNSKIITQLNVAWAARGYIFSSDWRLRWQQKQHVYQYEIFNDKEITNLIKDLH